jgi:diguanylate cyclase
VWCNRSDPALVADVTGALAAADLPPDALVLELTETALLSDVAKAARVLRELAGLGVRIALDDFGTGFSSLTHLRSLPIDTVKIDRSFVGDIRSGTDDSLVRAILGLATTLGLQQVAEGVETGVQADRLRGLRCRYGQGYHFSRPLPPDDLAALLPAVSVAPLPAGGL